MMIGLRAASDLPSKEELDLALALDNLASYLRTTELRLIKFGPVIEHLQQLAQQRDSLFFKQGGR